MPGLRLLPFLSYYPLSPPPPRLGLSANSTKWSNTLEQFLGWCRQTVSVCLTFLWGWHPKNYDAINEMNKKHLADHIENLKKKVVVGNDIQGLYN